MDKQMIIDHLVLAERHVTQGEEHIAKQRALVEHLRSGGHDIVQAEALLAEFESMQQMHIEDRDRLIGELRDQRERSK